MSIHLGRLKKVDLREFFKDEVRDWFLEMTESFHKVFSPRVKQL